MHYGWRNPRKVHYLTGKHGDLAIAVTEEEERDLGVLSDSFLQFSQYVHPISAKADAVVGII